MRVARTLIVLLLPALLLVLIAACGPGTPKVDEAREAEWASIQEGKEAIDSLRREIAQLEESLDDAADPEGGEVGSPEGEDPALEREELETQLAAKRNDLQERADSLMQRVVAFLNADPLIEGEPPNERQLAAIRIKSSEDMILAQEYIDKGGDYRRAIDIYQAALMLDPDNEELSAALAAAEEARYMSQERFAEAKKGMTQDEIRAVLGQVNLHNIRDYPDRNVTAWFYPTAEGGYASAVWFREDKKSGELKVYQLKYDAVSPDSPAGE